MGWCWRPGTSLVYHENLYPPPILPQGQVGVVGPRLSKYTERKFSTGDVSVDNSRNYTWIWIMPWWGLIIPVHMLDVRKIEKRLCWTKICWSTVAQSLPGSALLLSEYTFGWRQYQGVNENQGPVPAPLGHSVLGILSCSVWGICPVSAGTLFWLPYWKVLPE